MTAVLATDTLTAFERDRLRSFARAAKATLLDNLTPAAMTTVQSNLSLGAGEGRWVWGFTHDAPGAYLVGIYSEDDRRDPVIGFNTSRSDFWISPDAALTARP